MEPILTDYEKKEIQGLKYLLNEVKRRVDETLRCIDGDGLDKYNDAYGWLRSVSSYYRDAEDRLDYIFKSIERRQKADPNTPRDPALESSTCARFEILKGLVGIQNRLNSAIFYASEKKYNYAITLLDKVSPEIFLIVELMRKTERRKHHRKG